MDGLVAKIYLGQIVHVMVQFRLQQVVGNHGVKHGAFNTYPVVAQNQNVIFYVLSYL